MMTKQQRRFFSAQTVEQAVVLAARHYGVDPKEISYREVEKRHGFLKVRRSALIEVDPETVGQADAGGVEAPPQTPIEEPDHDSGEHGLEPGPEPSGEVVADSQEPASAEPDSPPVEPEEVEDFSPPAPEINKSDEPDEPEEPLRPPADAEPRRERRPSGAMEGQARLRNGPRRASDKYPPAEGEIAEAAREAMEMTLELAGLDLEFAVLQGDDRLEIELWGADDGQLLADRGQILLAIQLLLPRLIRGKTEQMVPCRVDCGDFHEIREERLRDLAQTIAGEVRHAGQPRKLRPMSPDERRIVHITLADDPAVTTESEGEGFFKRVRVSPA